MLRQCVHDRFRFVFVVAVLTAASCGGASGGADGEGGEAGEGGGGGGAGGDASEGGEGGEGGSASGGATSGGKGGSSQSAGAAGNGSGSGGKGGTGPGGTGGSTGGTAGATSASPLAFYKTECASCHGEKGEGTVDGPEIQHPVRAYAKEVIRKGRTGHPDYKDDMEAFTVSALPDASLNAIFDFLDSPPKPTTGKALYADYCQNCHGNKGDNGLAAHAVTTHIADIPRLVRAGHGGTSYLSRTSYMPLWTPQQLSDAELKLIADAVPTL